MERILLGGQIVRPAAMHRRAQSVCHDARCSAVLSGELVGLGVVGAFEFLAGLGLCAGGGGQVVVDSFRRRVVLAPLGAV